MRRMLFLFFSFSFILIGCNDSEKDSVEIEDGETIVPVYISDIKMDDFIVEQSVFGQAMPERQTPILIQHQGELTEIRVENGERVKKDERIGTIKTEMGSFHIKAPKEGEIANLQLEKGDIYTGEDPLAIVFEDETIALHFSVVPELRNAFKVDRTYKAIINDKEYEAEIKEIASLPNESGQFNLVAHVNNEKKHILAGMMAEIFIEDKREKDAIIIPTEAIVTEGEDQFIYKIEQSAVKKVPITVLHTQTEETAIEAEDLDEKDEIVIDGQFLLTDGSEVEIIKEGK